jgi:hypothetical protein
MNIKTKTTPNKEAEPEENTKKMHVFSAPSHT